GRSDCSHASGSLLPLLVPQRFPPSEIGVYPRTGVGKTSARATAPKPPGRFVRPEPAQSSMVAIDCRSRRSRVTGRLGSAPPCGERGREMGKVEERRAAIVAAQAAREAAEKEARRLTDPPRAPRKPKGAWQGSRPRGRPPKPAE